MPLVSVIVPNYNHARFLERRMQSILQQTLQNFEVIILDDASTDKSKEIIEQYRSHPQVKQIVYNETNSGSPFKQWKKGIALATGEWLWIAESDDYCELDFLEMLAPAFENAECVLAFHEATWVNETGEQLKAPYQYNAFTLPGKEFIARFMLHENRLVNAGQLLFRRQAMEKVLPNWCTYRRAGDYRLFCEILTKGNVHATGIPKAFFVRHAGALSLQGQDNPVAKAECNETWQWLQQSGTVSAAQFANVFTALLAGLETIQKGLPKLTYSHRKEELQQLAHAMGLPINHWRILYESYRLKAAHWWHSKWKTV